MPPGNWILSLPTIQFADIPVEVFFFTGAAFAGFSVPAVHQMGPLRP